MKKIINLILRHHCGAQDGKCQENDLNDTVIVNVEFNKTKKGLDDLTL